MINIPPLIVNFYFYQIASGNLETTSLILHLSTRKPSHLVSVIALAL